MHAGSKRFLRNRPKPYTVDRVKGVSKKLQRKVEKVIQHSKNYGKYTYYSYGRIRQVNTDRYSILTTDGNTEPLEFFSPLRLLDAASILFNAKGMSPTFNNQTGNLPDGGKISIQNAYVEFTFKSTSSHVINLEIYECTAKVSQNIGFQPFIVNSYTTWDSGYTNFAGSSIITPAMLGTSAKDWVELYKYFNVKAHHIKLLPGESSTLFIQGPKSKIIDLTKYQDNSILQYFAKGLTKGLYIRVINDPTVSATLGNGYVHHWPSNDIGGVAFTYKCVTRLNAPEMVNNVSTADVNRVRIGDWMHTVTTETDQQVVYENPVSVTANLN